MPACKEAIKSAFSLHATHFTPNNFTSQSVSLACGQRACSRRSFKDQV